MRVTDRPSLPKLIVPAYFNPVTHPEDWATLERLAPRLHTVIVNPASGPGTQRDDSYLPVLLALRAGGVPVVGYVDTDYARRPLITSLNEVSRHLEWYGVDGVFFDQVAAGVDSLAYYRALTLTARALGASTVAFNHGTQPVEGYADLADLIGIFEGPWQAYIGAAVPRWIRDRPQGQSFHLVYAVPPEHFDNAMDLAARRNAAAAYVTGDRGPNPYGRLPPMRGQDSTP